VKRFSVVFMVIGMLAAVLSSCSQPSSSKEETTEITKIVHQFEQAYFQSNYEEEKKYLYNPDDYTVDKDKKKREGVQLKYEEMCFKVYYLTDEKQYIVFTEFPNPLHSKTVNHKFLLRQKDGAYKIDTKKSLYVNEAVIPTDAKENVVSIHCE
jgi:hypothetical protein